MASTTERSAEIRETKRGKESLRLCLLLSCMVMVYKGSTTMYKSALNHHLYHRFLLNKMTTNFTRITSADNGTSIPNICYPNQSIKMEKDFAQELADKHQGRLLSVASSISLVILIIFGIISDTFGRKFILLSTTLAFSLQCTVAAIFIQQQADTSLYYIPYVIDGLGGSMFGFNLGCFLVVADTVVSRNERALGLALIEGLNGVGSITTEFSTLYMVKRYGATLPIIISSVAVIFLFIAVSLCLPRRTCSVSKYDAVADDDDGEEEEKKDQHTSDVNSNHSCVTLRKLGNAYTMFYFSRKYYGQRKIFWICFVTFCLVESPIVFRSELIPLIQIGWPNCWSVSLTNIYMFAALGLNYVIAMVLIIPLQYCFTDPAIALLGIVSAIAFNVTTAFANCKEIFFWGVAAGTFMIIPKPIIRSIASRRAGPKHQGALFAGFLASELLCEVTSEIIFIYIYSHRHGPADGKIFFFIGGSLCIALGNAMYLRDVTKRPTSLDNHTANECTPINSSTSTGNSNSQCVL